MTYADTVLTVGTVLLVSPVVVVLLTYMVRGTPKNRIGTGTEPSEGSADMLTADDDFENDFKREDCHAIR